MSRLWKPCCCLEVLLWIMVPFCFSYSNCNKCCQTGGKMQHIC
jgi:hypothetical protein